MNKNKKTSLILIIIISLLFIGTQTTLANNLEIPLNIIDSSKQYTFNKQYNVNVNKIWRINFNRNFKLEEVEEVKVMLKNKIVDSDISYSKKEIIVKPILNYDYKTEYNLIVILKNGNKYNMLFETKVEPEDVDLTVIGSSNFNRLNTQFTAEDEKYIYLLHQNIKSDYYTGNTGAIYRLNKIDNNIEKIYVGGDSSEEGMLDQIHMGPDGCLYLGEYMWNAEEYRIIKIDRDGSNKQFIKKSPYLMYFTVTKDGWIYYNDSVKTESFYDDYFTYKMKLDGSKNQKIDFTDRMFLGRYQVDSNENVYAILQKNRVFYLKNLTTNKDLIVDENLDKFLIYDDYIYFQYQTGEAFRCNLDGSNKVKLDDSNRVISFLNKKIKSYIFIGIENDNLYIRDFNKNDLYLLNINTLDLKRVNGKGSTSMNLVDNKLYYSTGLSDDLWIISNYDGTNPVTLESLINPTLK